MSNQLIQILGNGGVITLILVQPLLLGCSNTALEVGELHSFRRPNGQRFTVRVTTDKVDPILQLRSFQLTLTNSSKEPLRISVEQLVYIPDVADSETLRLVIGIREYDALKSVGEFGPEARKVLESKTSFVVRDSKAALELKPTQSNTSLVSQGHGFKSINVVSE